MTATTWRPGETMPPSLAANFRWLHTEGCTCSHMHGSYGRLYGISMGNGWIRTTTDPACPHHGEAAS